MYILSFFVEEWPRLLKSEQKPGWLKIDFDKLRLEDSDKEEEDETERINVRLNRVFFP